MRAGPGSITWKINREVIVVAGWGRAILLQLAHPAVAAGVHDHSSFRGSIRSSFRRLHSTVGAMLSLTFGDTEQMIAAAARHQHDSRPGTRSHRATGRASTYSAHDPDLQRWVHATLLESIPLMYELLVRTARRVVSGIDTAARPRSWSRCWGCRQGGSRGTRRSSTPTCARC